MNFARADRLRAQMTLVPHIGIFDSGVGGLSVLRALRPLLPGVRMSYIADSAHAPYGERDDDFIVARSLALARALRERGANLLVVACNTATAAAVHALRDAWPDWPIVGVEPGIKPAVAASASGRIGVMATTSTLNSARFARLVAEHAPGRNVHLQRCHGLVAAIEQGDLAAPALLALLDGIAAQLRQAQVDTVVLGCTHYPFIAPALVERLPAGTRLIDTSEAIARRAQALLPADARILGEGEIELWSTGDPAPLARLAQVGLGWPVTASHIAA